MKTRRIFLSPASLSRALQKLRRGKRVVFTNGCFDLLHVGHLRVLEYARKQGDILVVALNSDGSVRRLKGPRRPLLPLRERAELMSALKPVDFVTSFEEETPLEAIRALRPDVLVKGGDWAKDQIVGRGLVKKIVRVPLVPGRSTTGTIESILKKFRGRWR
ncbi:MAG: adenylyltransferase/cytidyltransferase family protein [Elusimicrobia bacterium]|nr:adenylyltransferase/cytidyltransferase family protein [Elusimicrobiota bacterium]